jgi:hypothetical protein
VVREVRCKHKCLRADGLGHIRNGALFEFERDETLAAKIGAWPLFQVGNLKTIVFRMLIHVLQPIRHPAAAGLHKANAKARVPLQNSTENQTCRGGHLLHGMSMQMEK